MLHRALGHGEGTMACDEQAGRAYANLYSMYSRSMRIAEGEGVLVEGIAYCDEHDISTFANCLRGERAIVLERLGRWDEAEALRRRAAAPHRPVAGQPAQPAGQPRPSPRPARRRGVPGSASTRRCAWPTDWTSRSGRARPNRPGRGVLAGGPGRRRPGRAGDCRAGAPHRTARFERGALAVWRRRDHWRRPSEPDPGLTRAVRDASWRATTPAPRSGGTACGLRYDAALALLGSDDEALLREALAELDDLGAAPAAAIARQQLRQLGVRSIPSGRSRVDHVRTRPA